MDRIRNGWLNIHFHGWQLTWIRSELLDQLVGNYILKLNNNNHQHFCLLKIIITWQESQREYQFLHFCNLALSWMQMNKFDSVLVYSGTMVWENVWVKQKILFTQTILLYSHWKTCLTLSAQTLSVLLYMLNYLEVIQLLFTKWGFIWIPPQNSFLTQYILFHGFTWSSWPSSLVKALEIFCMFLYYSGFYRETEPIEYS
jgi:hypothetical protein